MKCPKCQKEISDAALFCKHCGISLQNETEESRNTEEENFVPVYENPYKVDDTVSEEWDPYAQILQNEETEESAAVKAPDLAADIQKEETVEDVPAPSKKKSKFPVILALILVGAAVYVGYKQGARVEQTVNTGDYTAKNQITESGTEELIQKEITKEPQQATEVVFTSTPTPEPEIVLTSTPTPEPEIVLTSTPTPEPKVTEELFEISVEEELNMETENSEIVVEESVSVVSLMENQNISMDSAKKIKIASAEATSTIKQEKTTNEPMLMFDGRPDTNWQEGVDGAGIGQSFTATFQETSKVKYITFLLGNWKNDNYYYGNNRPKVLFLELGDVCTQVEFPDRWEKFCVEITPACEASSLKVTIDEVYAGTSWDDTVIAEINLYRE